MYIVRISRGLPGIEREEILKLTLLFENETDGMVTSEEENLTATKTSWVRAITSFVFRCGVRHIYIYT